MIVTLLIEMMMIYITMRRCREGRRHRRETPVTIFALLLHLAVQRRHRSPGSSSRFDFFSSHVFKFSSFFFCARVFFVLIFDEEKGAHIFICEKKSFRELQLLRGTTFN